MGIADLDQPRATVGVPVVAVLAGGYAVEIVVRPGDDAVTVVVRRVGAVRLICARMHRGIRVVAVLIVRRIALGCRARDKGVSDPVPIGVGVGVPPGCVDGLLVDGAVAIVVNGIAALHRAGVHGRIGVITVVPPRNVPVRRLTRDHRHRDVPVIVHVRVPIPGVAVDRVLVHGIVAVVVETVTHLISVGVDGRVRVVAVNCRVETIVVGVDRHMRDLHVGTAEEGQQQEDPCAHAPSYRIPNRPASRPPPSFSAREPSPRLPAATAVVISTHGRLPPHVLPMSAPR